MAESREPQRQNRRMVGPRSLSKTYSIPEDLVAAVQQEALRQGHRNGSRIVVEALIAYFNRLFDRRAA